MNDSKNPQSNETHIKFNRAKHESEDIVLTDGVLKFLSRLDENFGSERDELLKQRQNIQKAPTTAFTG